MLRHIGLLSGLYLFWLLLSGHWTAFLLAAGAGSVLAVAFAYRRMDEFSQGWQGPGVSWTALLGYIPWLLGQVGRSAWHVSLRILHPRLPISPAMVRFTPSQRTEAGLFIHANSITLTPGTISVEAGRAEFLVHALTAEASRDLQGSEMDRRVSRLEGTR